MVDKGARFKTRTWTAKRGKGQKKQISCSFKKYWTRNLQRNDWMSTWYCWVFVHSVGLLQNHDHNPYSFHLLTCFKDLLSPPKKVLPPNKRSRTKARKVKAPQSRLAVIAGDPQHRKGNTSVIWRCISEKIKSHSTALRRYGVCWTHECIYVHCILYIYHNLYRPWKS